MELSRAASRPIDTVVLALRAAGYEPKRHGSAWQCRCPAHADTDPSLSIGEGADGRALVHCFAGCGAKSICEAIGLHESALFVKDQPDLRLARPEPPPRVYPSLDALVATLPCVTKTYRYTDPATRQVQLAVIRHEKDGRKGFYQCSPYGEGWAMRAPEGKLPIYNRARVAGAGKVVVVEGEGCVHALADIGVVATTSPGGAGKAHLADWSPLAGKEVTLWPDNDPENAKGERVGIAHMQAVASILEALDPPCRLAWIDPDGLDLPPKGDVVDLLAECEKANPGSGPATVRAVIDDADPMGASVDVRGLLDDMIEGRWINQPWPWPTLTGLARALLPGAVTILCGPPSSAKSLMLMQAVAHWNLNGVKAAVMQMEEDRRFHLHRALAQHAQCTELLDDRWVRDNPEEAIGIVRAHEDFLDSMGRCVYEPKPGKDRLLDIGEWVCDQLGRGKRVVCVDPITAGAMGERSWAEELDFVNMVKRKAKETKGSVVLVTHPKKGAKGKGLDELAGASAYQRLVSCVLWLSTMQRKKDRTVMVETPFGAAKGTDCDRLISILKARNGRGTGKDVAFRFCSKSLTFEELGKIAEDED